jgi:hypothetical protein
MKTLLTICLSLLVVSGLSFSAAAQTKEQHQASVSEHHGKVLEHTKALKEGSGMSKADMANHEKMAGEHLAKAHEAHQAMEGKMTAAEKAKPEHQAVKKHHAEAMMHHKALHAEVSKAKPDEAKVKEHASMLHESVTKAETQHKMAHKK